MSAGRTQHTQGHRNNLVWLMWGLLAFAYLISYFHRISLAVVMDYLIIDLQIGEAALAGALAGSYAIIYMIMQIPTGFLVDSWGPRKTAAAGMIVAAAGSLVFALSPVLSFAFLGRALVGLGVSVIFVSALKFLVNWFKPSQFATMTGLTGLVGNLGVALGTTPLAILVVYFGWRQTFMAIAIMTLVVALACWLLVRDNPAFYMAAPSASVQPAVTFSQLMEALRKVIKNFKTWPLFASAFGLYGTLFAFTGAWSVTYLMQVYGFERGQAANYMLVLTAGIIVGLPLTGYMSDRLGRRRLPLIVIFAVYTAVWGLFFAWNGKPPLAALYPLFLIMGLAGGAGSVILPLSREVNDAAFAGVALSIVNIGPFAGTAFLQPLMGYMLDLRWDGIMLGGMKLYPLASYRLLFGICLVTLLITFFFALISIKETNCRNIYGEKGHKK
jgi:MFS family permease